MPRTAKANQIVKDARREQILSAALKVFSAKGPAASKISDIAREAAMSQGLLYHYFGSKDEIFTELIDMAFAKMNLAATGLADTDMPARDKVALAVTQLLDDLANKDEFSQTILLIAQAGVSDSIPAEARDIILANRKIPYEAMARVFADGIREQTVKNHDPMEMAVIFWITIKGLAMHKATFGPEYASPAPELILNNFLL